MGAPRTGPFKRCILLLRLIDVCWRHVYLARWQLSWTRQCSSNWANGQGCYPERKRYRHRCRCCCRCIAVVAHRLLVAWLCGCVVARVRRSARADDEIALVYAEDEQDLKPIS